MKKSVRISLICLFLVLIGCCLTGCARYRSSYKAVAFVDSNNSNSALMSFYQFEGTMVFKMNNKIQSGTRLEYTAKLEEGNLTVYWDTDGNKTELVSVSAGEETTASHNLTQKGTVYIIVETDGKCMNGDFHFEIKE